MTESVFQRVKRTVVAHVETAVDALERANGPALMREAIRQIERAIGELAADHDRALGRAVQAEMRSGDLTKELVTLSENARFAMEKKREDLARAALSRQVDIEADIVTLKGVVRNAKQEAVRLLEAQAALRAQHQQMSAELAAFEKAQGSVAPGSPASVASASDVETKVRHAKDAFDRVMKASTGLDAHDNAPSDQRKVMEIRELQRENAIDERLKALKAAAPAKAATAKKSSAKAKAAKK
ncbi:MAG: PspA/IM30 family protein [Sphingobium sp.]|nr:PspA/IM30 family protein [Sphingobium sp.]